MNINLNVHPIFVHFPIALLTVYSVFEFIRHGKLNSRSEWFWVKAILLILGTLGAFVAVGTGSIAAEYHRDVRTLVHAHENFAQLTTFLYSVLSLNYLILILEQFLRGRILSKGFQKIWSWILKLRSVIFKAWVIVILTIAALVCLLTTGALGGAIVYGPDADPFISVVYKIFVGQ